MITDLTQHEPEYAAPGTLARTRVVLLVTALGLAAGLAMSVMSSAGSAEPNRSPADMAPFATRDPSQFLLEALLVPALDRDAVPLRFVDPRAVLHCGPDTTVRVNRQPLVPGALVPVTPFELELQTDGCRPAAARGMRFDGWVRMTVFHEDWGFSAMVEPSVVRVAMAGGSAVPRALNSPETPHDEVYDMTFGNEHPLAPAYEIVPARSEDVPVFVDRKHS